MNPHTKKELKMLVFRRKRGESIKIGDDIEITVVETHTNHTQISIEAPPHIPVHRKETYEEMKRQSHIRSLANSLGETENEIP
jgi:carbon storage regulator